MRRPLKLWQYKKIMNRLIKEEQVEIDNVVIPDGNGNAILLRKGEEPVRLITDFEDD